MLAGQRRESRGVDSGAIRDYSAGELHISGQPCGTGRDRRGVVLEASTNESGPPGPEPHPRASSNRTSTHMNLHEENVLRDPSFHCPLFAQRFRGSAICNCAASYPENNGPTGKSLTPTIKKMSIHRICFEPDDRLTPSAQKSKFDGRSWTRVVDSRLAGRVNLPCTHMSDFCDAKPSEKDPQLGLRSERARDAPGTWKRVVADRRFPTKASLSQTLLRRDHGHDSCTTRSTISTHTSFPPLILSIWRSSGS
ncbi:hypothetical protein IWX90DRAFT_40791 [Phyllosticta citrichinensis]|uniref:Uncharacterized protein n=1 Tax=Phyllosticta citrichinensis TaxID=1130410 RepID=A0ABR1Y912_9PEZI